MSLKRKIVFAVALAAPLLFLTPPDAEAQTIRGRAYYQPYAQRYYPQTGYYYGPRSQYYRGAPRYYSPRYDQGYRGGYYQPYRGYYGDPRYYGRGSMRVGPLWFGW